MATRSLEVASQLRTRKHRRPFLALPAVARVSWHYVMRNLCTSASLLAADATAATFSFFLASVFFQTSGVLSAPAQFVSWALFCTTTLLFLATLRLYPAIAMHPVVEMKRCIIGTGAAAAALCVWTLATRWQTPGVTLALVGFYGCIALPLVPLCRSVVRGVCSRFGWWGQRAIVLGAGRRTTDLLCPLDSYWPRGLHPVGVVDRPSSGWLDCSSESIPYLGPPEELAELARQHDAF